MNEYINSYEKFTVQQNDVTKEAANPGDMREFQPPYHTLPGDRMRYLNKFIYNLLPYIQSIQFKLYSIL